MDCGEWVIQTFGEPLLVGSNVLHEARDEFVALVI
jgi:hypothetical protein